MTIHSPRTRGGPALAGAVAVLLGVGLAPALAGSATPVSAAPVAAAHPHHHRATTHLHGFAKTPASVPLGAMVVDKVGVRPRARRVIRVQALGPGATAFVTVSSGRSTKAGGFLARYIPASAGAWRFRLVIPATQHAKGLVSASRDVTATTTPTSTDTTPPGPVSAVTVAQATGSDLTLSWTNPTDADFAGVIIRRAQGATPPTSPADGAAVTATGKAANSFTDTGLAGDTTYSYALFAFDTSSNKATAATRTVISGAATTAALTVNGFSGSAAKETVNVSDVFDFTGTHAGNRLTVASGHLDYGDGQFEDFVGDPSSWFSIGHQYATTGTETATLSVVDSAHKTVTKTMQIKVFAQPTVSVVITKPPPFEQGKEITFSVTSDTPVGTSFTDFDTFSDGGDNFVAGAGAPPGTFTITLPAGSHTVTVDGFNDAGGLATFTIDVPVV